MVWAERKKRMEAYADLYPQIRNARELAQCVRGAKVIGACGFQKPDRHRALKSLLDRVRREGQLDGLTVIWEEQPSGWPARGVLLCTEGLSARQEERLMQQLYEADCVILGVVTEEALAMA